jgi:hypothetical protein
VLLKYQESTCSRNIKRAQVLSKEHRGSVLQKNQESACSKNFRRVWVLQKKHRGRMLQKYQERDRALKISREHGCSRSSTDGACS